MRQKTIPHPVPGAKRSQQGASLIIVLIVLTIVSLLGVAGIQVSMMSERGARNDRDMQLAWQSAEAGLVDAEFDLFGTTGLVSTRSATFKPAINLTLFADGCGIGTNAGLCSLVSSGKPAWLTVPFTVTGSAAQSAFYGQFTGRSFAAGALGIQPAAIPRYVIEAIRDPGDRDTGSLDGQYVYRVTAMGFGPRTDVQAVLQMIYRN